MVEKFSLFVVLAVILIAYAAQAKPPQRIFGGEYARIGEFPYQVSLRTVNNKHICGGTIVSRRHILTAAHCVVHLQRIADLYVVTGTISSINDGQTHRAADIKYHKDYTHDVTGAYDLAIIALESPINFNAYQSSIKRPTGPTRTGVRAMVTGWGTTNFRYPGNSEYLRKLEVRTIAPAECQQWEPTKIYEHQICTFAMQGDGVCWGDSGGPLVNNAGELIGVVSYGTPCGAGVPDIFTSVWHHADWIDHHVNTI